LSLGQQILEPLKGAANVANKMKRIVFCFCAVSLLAGIIFITKLLSLDLGVTWNLVVSSVAILPVMVLLFIWMTLNNFSRAPQVVLMLIEQEEDAQISVTSLNVKKPQGIRSLITMAKKIREEDGLNIVADTIGGIAIFTNPIFWLLASVCVMLLVLLIVTAPFFLIF